MTLKQTALAFLAGSVVAVAGLTLQFTGVRAQDRLTVKVARDNYRTARLIETPDGDGGIIRRDLWQEAADDCRAARRAFADAKEQHVETGSPSAEALKQRRASAKVVCDDYTTLSDSVEAARAAYEGADYAYGCEYLDGPCPPTDGGSP